MSDISGDASSQLLNAMGGEPEGTPTGGESSPEIDYSKMSPFAQNFLASVDETERPIVAKHLGSWDSGFTQHSQRINAQLTPYQQLGSPDEFRTMKEAFEHLKADPNGFVGQLAEMGLLDGWTRAEKQQLAQQMGEGQQPPVQQPAYDIKSDPEFKRMQQALGLMSQTFQQQQEEARTKEVEQRIEADLSQAESKHGPFNKLYVLNLMAASKGELTVDAAVMAWKNELQQAMAAQRTPPSVVGASSAPPQAPGPLNTSDERASALATMMQQFKGA